MLRVRDQPTRLPLFLKLNCVLFNKKILKQYLKNVNRKTVVQVLNLLHEKENQNDFSDDEIDTDCEIFIIFWSFVKKKTDLSSYENLS